VKHLIYSRSGRRQGGSYLLPDLRSRRERGFSTLFAAPIFVVMVGMVGLSFDIGRMFVVKNELQTFADASALAAAAMLDGTKAGVTAANNVATVGPLGQTEPNRYSFDSNRITNVTTAYATSFNGTYVDYATASGPATNSYRFINVTASATIPLYFLPVIKGLGFQQTLSATAIAGQRALSAANTAYSGGFPFSPAAHDGTDTRNFGLTPGVSYTLKWGNGNSTTCAGDIGWNGDNSAPSAHGFVDLGQGSGNSSLRNVIEFGGYPNPSSNPSSLYAGMTLYQVAGNRGSSIFGAVAARSSQDPDQTSITWAQYQAAGKGNGRRVVTAPIHDPALNAGNGSNFHYGIIGFGNFLLDIASNISGSSGPICATYIGPASASGPASAATDGTKIYAATLYQ
jgi:Flp pilus assembly protein TadG